MLMRQNQNPARVHLHPPGEFDTEVNLGVIAYENIHKPVFHEWLKLDPDRRRDAWLDRYVFYSCACCLGAYVEERLKHDFVGTNAFVADVIGEIVYLANGRTSYTEEWFKGINRLVEDFTTLNFIAEARQLVAVGLRTGVRKYPGLAVSLSVHAAYLDALTGRREKATKVALKLVQSPYLLPSRRELPSLYQRLMYILASGNHLWEYRLVLWTGVNLLQANDAVRDAFSAQIAKTYRGTLRALITNDVPLKYRVPFLLSNAARVLSGRLGLDKPIRCVHLGLLFLLDRLFLRKNELFCNANRVALSHPPVSSPMRHAWRTFRAVFVHRTPRILVTRAMGGIGDILMMTPGLRALAAKYPQAKIDFAIPKSFHSIVEGLPGVQVLDIHEDPIDLSAYNRWINLTDCPAARVESRQYPDVKRNRIESFAKAMGVSKWRLKLNRRFVPVYQIKEDERKWARARMMELNPEDRTVIGIQPYSADSYKNWPYMRDLVKRLSETYCVLIFHHEALDEFEGSHVHKIVEPLRRSISLASLCDWLVVVDSSFLHISAAIGIPTIALFGPTSGKVFCRYYNNVKYLTPSKPAFPCYPCWRNEHKPCHLTNGRESICLRTITVEDVLTEIQTKAYARNGDHSLIKDVIHWIRYGRE